MLKAGIAVGVIMLLVTAVLGFVNPLVVLCIAPFAGAVAGFWGAAAERAADNAQATRLGTTAGLLAGAGVLLGHIFTATAAIGGLGPFGAAALIEQFGFGVEMSTPLSFYAMALGISACAGTISLAISAITGSVGGMLWRSTGGRPRPA